MHKTSAEASSLLSQSTECLDSLVPSHTSSPQLPLHAGPATRFRPTILPVDSDTVNSLGESELDNDDKKRGSSQSLPDCLDDETFLDLDQTTRENTSVTTPRRVITPRSRSRTSPFSDRLRASSLSSDNPREPGRGLKRRTDTPARKPQPSKKLSLGDIKASLAKFEYVKSPTRSPEASGSNLATSYSEAPPALSIPEPATLNAHKPKMDEKQLLEALKSMEERLNQKSDDRATQTMKEIIKKVTEESKKELDSLARDLNSRLDLYRKQDEEKWANLEIRLRNIEARQVEVAPDVVEIRAEMKSNIQESIKEAHEKQVLDLENIFAHRLSSALAELDTSERRAKKLNIIVRGLNCEPGATIKSTQELLKSKFDTDVDSADITSLQASKIVTVKLKDWDTKLNILKKKKAALDGTAIYIQSDLTARERYITGKLRGIAKTEKNKGSRVRLSYLKVEINDIGYTWDTSRNVLLPLPVHPQPPENNGNLVTTHAGNGFSGAKIHASQMSPSGMRMVLGD